MIPPLLMFALYVAAGASGALLANRLLRRQHQREIRTAFNRGREHQHAAGREVVVLAHGPLAGRVVKCRRDGLVLNVPVLDGVVGPAFCGEPPLLTLPYHDLSHLVYRRTDETAPVTVEVPVFEYWAEPNGDAA